MRCMFAHPSDSRVRVSGIIFDLLLIHFEHILAISAVGEETQTAYDRSAIPNGHLLHFSARRFHQKELGLEQKYRSR